jgi:hypothetical protein
MTEARSKDDVCDTAEGPAMEKSVVENQLEERTTKQVQSFAENTK